MSSRLALALLLAVGVTLAAPQVTHADYVRFELGTTTRARLPQDFTALTEACSAAGYNVMWPDGPYYDQWASSYGAGEYGGFTITQGYEELYVQWLRTDTEEAAALDAADRQLYATPGSGVASARDGRVVITVTSYAGNDALAHEILESVRQR